MCVFTENVGDEMESHLAFDLPFCFFSFPTFSFSFSVAGFALGSALAFGRHDFE